MNFNRDLFAVNYAIRKIAAWIKPVGWIPAAVVRQIIVTAVHQDDGIRPQPPITRVRSDAKVHVGPIAEPTMQRKSLVRLGSVAEHRRAAGNARLFVDPRAGMSLVTTNFVFASDFRAFRSVHVLVDIAVNVRPGPLTFSGLDVLATLTWLNVLFRSGRFRLWLRLLLLFVGRRGLCADRQSNSNPHCY